MPPKHSLICPSCQQQNEVAVTQAGQEFECVACQVVIQAPRLGELKQLPLIGGKATTRPQAAKKGGRLFVIGLLLFLIGGLGGGGLCYYGTQKLFDYDIEQAIQITSTQIDSYDLMDLVSVYDQLPVDKGLGQWQERSYVGLNKQGQILIKISYAMMAGGVLIGLPMMLIGLFR